MSFTKNSTYLKFPSNCVFSAFFITGNAENAQLYLKFVRFHNIDYNFLARCFFRYHNYNVWHGILLGSIQCSSLKTAFLLAWQPQTFLLHFKKLDTYFFSENKKKIFKITKNTRYSRIVSKSKVKTYPIGKSAHFSNNFVELSWPILFFLLLFFLWGFRSKKVNLYPDVQVLQSAWLASLILLGNLWKMPSKSLM